MVSSINKKKLVFFTLKLFITIGLCAVVTFKMDWGQAWNALKQINPFLVATVFAAMMFNLATCTIKWKILLSVHGIRSQFSQLYKYYLTASFFNNFLPSTIGGDSYRIYKTYDNPITKAGAFTAVFMERLTGLLALMIIGFLAGFMSFRNNGDDISKIVIYGGIAGIAITVIVSFAIKAAASSVKGLFREKLPKKVEVVLNQLRVYRYQDRKLVFVALLSLFFQFFLILYKLLLLNAVGGTISFSEMAVAVALSTIVALLPISINGFGLLDGSFIYLLTTYHVDYKQAFIVMVLIRLLNFALSLTGGIFYIFDKESLRVERSRLTA